MRASLADQARTLALGLGANLPSPAGEPLVTLVALRPLLAAALRELWATWGEAPPVLQWSPLFRTAPVGGPPGQPDYLTAVLLVRAEGVHQERRSLELLDRLQQLECQFGRERRERWGPRSLDLDLLWWGGLQCRSERLELPHPLWRQRPFVLAPLAALQGVAPQPDWPQPLPGRSGWPE
ncbi:MAG: 2-amino-4-hydroxy-6-hydroxymethyldihydropteridine diphosphokinase [Vulcanococcus sp.]